MPGRVLFGQGWLGASILMENIGMTSIASKIMVALVAVVFLSSCANTIRGLGRDTSNSVDATQNAAEDVVN